MRWILLAAAIAQTACATIDERERVESVVIEQQPFRQTLNDKIIVEVHDSDVAIAVDAHVQPRCRQDNLRTLKQERVIERRLHSATAIVVNSIGAAVLAGVGLYFVASAPTRPALNDPYSRDELSQEGSYGIGFPVLAGSLAFGSALIVDGVRARDRHDPLPQRTEQLPGAVSACGPTQSVTNAEVTLQPQGSNRRFAARTDSVGHADFRLDDTLLSALDEAAGSLVVASAGRSIEIDLSDHEGYRTARARREQQLAARQREFAMGKADAREARTYLEDALRHDNLVEARSYLEAARNGLSAADISTLEKRVDQLQTALSVRDARHARLLPQARQVAIVTPTDLRAAPSEPDSRGRLDPGPQSVIAEARGWLGVATAAVATPPAWSDVAGWIKSSETMSVREWQQKQDRDAHREQAAARHAEQEAWKPQTLRRRFTDLVRRNLDCVPTRIEKIYNMGMAIEGHGVCRHRAFNGWPWHFVCFCYPPDTNSCTCDLREPLSQ